MSFQNWTATGGVGAAVHHNEDITYIVFIGSIGAAPRGFWSLERTILEEPAPLATEIYYVEVAAGGGTAWDQPIDDTLSLSDAVAFDRGEVLADSVTPSDSLSSQAVYVRQIDDTLSLTDALAQAEEIHIGDTLSLSDSATTAAGKGAQIDDTLSLSDSLSSAAVYARSVSDSVTPSDSLVSVTAYLRDLADSVTPSDVCTPVKGTGAIDWTQSVDDTLAVVDSMFSVRTYVRAVDDTLALSDSLSSVTAYLRSLADTLTLSDLLDADLETITEGFPGVFDTDTESGRSQSENEDANFDSPGALAATGARTTSAALTSVQRGKIGVR